MGFTITSKTNFEKKQISEQKLKLVFCMTNGNPRNAVRYFKEGNFGFMVNALAHTLMEISVMKQLNVVLMHLNLQV